MEKGGGIALIATPIFNMSIEILLKKLVKVVEEKSNNQVFLNQSVDDEVSSTIEQRLNMEFPTSVKKLYSIANGQSANGYPLFFGNPLNSLEMVLEDHSNMCLLNTEEYFDWSVLVYPENALKNIWFSKKWIPITGHYTGSYICIDMSPGSKGEVGQVILCDSGEDERFLVSHSLEEFLEFTIKSYEQNVFLFDGEFEDGFLVCTI